MLIFIALSWYILSMERFNRTIRLIGENNFNKLAKSKVAVFGIGGVGSFVAEALCRSGVGEIMLVDKDNVDITNINRQLIATTQTIGKPKVEVMAQRCKDINPQVVVKTKQVFFNDQTVGDFDLKHFDYIVDAIDTVSSKLLLIKMCKDNNVNIISCMGTGNKLDPTQFEITDIYKTQNCPLAKVMRHELKQLGIKNLKVLYSKETPSNCDSEPSRIPASIAFVPSVAGLIIAGKVIKDLIK